MTQVFLLRTSGHSWADPGDWVNYGHVVELFSSGGNGAVGTNGASGNGGGGGGGGGYLRLSSPSGNLTFPVAFNVPAGGEGTATDVVWGNSTKTSTCYSVANGTSASGVTNGSGPTTYAETSPSITYSSKVFSAGANGGSSAKTNGGGGGGSVGGVGFVAPSVGGIGGSSSSTAGYGGGGAGNGTGGNASGQTGGQGSKGSGGGAGAGGTGNSGGGGANAGRNTTGGSGGSGNEFDATHGLGGGGGGSGADATNETSTNTGGGGGSYGGGGGGCGYARGTGTFNVGVGGDGLIVVTYGAPIQYAQSGQIFTSTKDRSSRGTGARGFSQFRTFPDLVPPGWNVERPQPPRRSMARSGAIMPSEGGIEATYVTPTVVTTVTFVDERPSASEARRRIHERGNAARGFSQFATFPNFPPMGWQVRDVQPGHPRPEKHGSIVVGDDGAQLPIPIVKLVGGWEARPHQPQYARAGPNARTLSSMFGDDGTLAAFAGFVPRGWEENRPTQPPSFPRMRAGAVMRGDDGVQDVLRQWFVRGWEMQDPLPPHRRPERSVSVIRGDDGTQSVLVNWIGRGWEVQDPPPRPRSASSGSRTLCETWGDDGTQGAYLRYNFFGLDNYERVRRLRLIRPGSIRREEEAGTHAKPLLNPIGWEIDPPITAACQKMRAAATMRGDEGNHDILRQWFVRGWDVQDVQPPHPRSERSAYLISGDDGIQGAYQKFWNVSGWSTQDVQPLRPNRRSGFTGDDGTQSPLVRFFPHGWEVPPPQQPCFVSYARARAAGTMRGDDGTSAAIVSPPVVTVTWGYGETPISHGMKKHWDAARGVSQFATFPNLKDFSWWMLEWQPPHMRTEKSATGMRGDDGNQDIYVPLVAVPLSPVGWEMSPLWQAPHRSPEGRSAAAFGKSQFATFASIQVFEESRTQFLYRRPSRWSATKGSALFAIYPQFMNWAGDEPGKVPHRSPRKKFAGTFFRDSPSPIVAPSALAPFAFDRALAHRHPLPERYGSIMPIETGIEAKIVFTPPQIQDQQWSSKPRMWRAAAVERKDDGTQAPIAPSPSIITLDAQWQPKLRGNRFDIAARGDDGTLSSYLRWSLISWGVQEQPRHPRPEVGGGIAHGDAGTQANLINVFPHGWEVPPPQHRALLSLPGIRAGSLMRGDDGNQDIHRAWYVRGWEIQDYQPPHPRSERSASFMPIETGTEAAPAVPSLITIAESGNQQWQPPTLRWWRSASTMLGDEGIRYNLVIPLAEGWKIQDVQPPHPRPEARAAGTMRGDDGTQYRLVIPFKEGWKVQDPQPPHPHPESKAAMMRGDDGNQSQYQFLLPLLEGWRVQDPPPPHPIPERRSAGTMLGDDGIQYIFSGISPSPEGWQIQEPQPPHPRPEKAGSIMPIELGTEDIVYNPATNITDFTTQPLYHRRVIRSGAVMTEEWWVDPTTNPWSLGWGLGFCLVFRPIPDFWETPPPQPPHPSPERRAAGIMPIELGTEAALVLPLILFKEGWGIRSVQPPHPRPEARAAGTMRGDDGTQYRFLTSFKEGWQIQDPQPPHPVPELSAGMMFGDDGTQLGFAPPTLGFPVQDPPPPHPTPERRAAGTMRGDDGIQYTFSSSSTSIEAWQVQPPQPPHPRPEKIGGVPIDPGIASPLVTAVTVPYFDWDMFQPTHNVSARKLRFTAEFLLLSIQFSPSPAAWLLDPIELIRPARRREAVEESHFILPHFPGTWGYDDPRDVRRARTRIARDVQRFELNIPFSAFRPWHDPIVFASRFARRPSKVRGVSQFATFPNLVPIEWTPQLSNPPRPRAWRSGSVMPGDVSGIVGFVVGATEPTKSTTSNSPVWLAVAFDTGLPPGR